jgi:GT2 family glycosyltransferase
MQFRLLVSILIITWNNRNHLFGCLDHLLTQTLDKFEVVLVDNGSEDGALDGLYENYPSLDLKIHKLSSNLGYAAANNIGARLARGKWLALLNADAFPRPDWLEKLVMTATKENGYDFFASRQIQADKPDLLDGAGDAYHISGLAWRRHYNKTVQENGTQSKEVFSVCPTAALYRREAFLNAGGFDEDYFSYFEDVDLGFRLRLAGKKCLYVPDAVVHHVGSASTGKRSDFSVYYGYRNMIWTFFKDMPSPLIWFFLPVHVVTLLFFVVYLSLRGQGKVILRAIRDAVRGLPGVLEKRNVIQKNKKIKPSELLKVMSTGLFEPYWEFMNRNRRA